MLNVRLASTDDLAWLVANDRHLPQETLDDKICRQEILVAFWNGSRVGWLRWGYFWDLVPFMNLLFVVAPQRGRAHGRSLVLAWEELMQSKGFDQVMTSTLANEDAQHFYRKLGYRDAGSLLLPDEALEIIFLKRLAHEERRFV